MRISKFYEARHTRGAKAPRKRDNYRREGTELVDETHYITIDGEAYEKIERIAEARKTTVARIVDAAINWMIDRERAA